ncbi:hypothetical protein P43SY_011084 [Pythium insidiosum]|uniref:Transmembrane protein 43 n=1 Tax=Pythium insidiosum TaxID=114742 RepID=A0AAD5L5T7_PYTIN|nr:hypothetical protein P43SY_011084 [Pythium insidiosum]
MQGDPSLTRTPYVLDPVFGVAARGVRLLRKVEMLQWVETSHTVDADGDGDERAEDGGDQGAGRQRERVYMYDLRWRSEHVDSSSFYDRSFQNPSQDAWIFQGKDIVADATVVGDFKLSDELIMQIPRQDDVSLSAESMAVMRNVLNQRVGEHWAEASSLKLATIEDNYVYMLRDGGSPTLGDLRISFKVVPPYTVTISGKQEMQHIRPFQATNGESILLIADGALGVSELYDKQIQKKLQHNRFFRLFTIVLAFIGFHVGSSTVVDVWEPRVGKTHPTALCATLALSWALWLALIGLAPAGILAAVSLLAAQRAAIHDKRD